MLPRADGRPWLLFGILACSLALNLVMVVERRGAPADGEPPADPAADPAAVAVAVAPVADGANPADAPAADPAAPAAPAVPAAEVAALGEWTVADTTVQSTLAGAFGETAAGDADALAAVFARLFVWDLDLRRDLRKGDRVEVAWRKLGEGQIEVLSARLHSQKLGRTYAAYRWQAPGDAFTSYWSEDGVEVPHRLKNSPLKDYEQITSLLKDRPTHKGMDFKAPTGTPITSPFSGTVTRSNWSFAGNGNCIEVRYADGAVAKFLHLSENRVQPGASVKPGDVVGLVGNTGRSTAAHLHYQVEVGGKVVDPLDYHGSVRRRVDGASMQALHKEIARQDALLAQMLAAR